VREFKADLIGDLSAGRARVTHFTSTSPSSLLLFGLTLIYWQGKTFVLVARSTSTFLAKRNKLKRKREGRVPPFAIPLISASLSTNWLHSSFWWCFCPMTWRRVEEKDKQQFNATKLVQVLLCLLFFSTIYIARLLELHFLFSLGVSLCSLTFLFLDVISPSPWLASFCFRLE
jgi:hypothetical protein